MTISTEQVKLIASQRLTDNTNGGGFMTATEIVDGNVNNLFPDISRDDRAAGRVSLRKGFVHIDTDNTEVYYGCHVILSELARDPAIGTVIFTTNDDADTRVNAINRLESYVTQGPRSQWYMWEQQPAGSRHIMLFTPNSKADAIEVGSVLLLFKMRGSASEELQFVSVQRVEEGSVNLGGSAVRTADVTIGDPLALTFPGQELHGNQSTPTDVYRTYVSDAAKYYGVMKLAEAIAENDSVIMVDSIFTTIVPTSQTETPLLNITPGEVGPVVSSGERVGVNFTNFTGTQLNVGQAFVPGSLSIVNGGVTYSDDGAGILMQGSNQAGTVEPGIGRVDFATAKSGTMAVSFDPGVLIPKLGQTIALPVWAQTRGYNYVGILWPPPEPGSISVDYRAEGRWYRLRDNGLGQLVPDIANTGTGQIPNYLSGHIAVTTAALPDVDSVILFRWGTPVEIIQLQGITDVDTPLIQYTLQSSPVQPGSLHIEWPIGINQTATATDDGHGNIIGAATGWIIYGSGTMEFKPTQIPVAGSEYKINYERYAAQIDVRGGIYFTLDYPPKPGTLAIDATVSAGGINHVYKLRDNGQGEMSAPGFSVTISQGRSSSTSGGTGGPISTSGGESNTTIWLGPVSATVDYVTGEVLIDMSGAGGGVTSITQNSVSSTSTVPIVPPELMLGG